MAYYLTYQCQFNNRNTNNIRVEFWQKDVFTDSYTLLPCVAVTSEYYDGNEEKYSPTIIGLKLEVRIRAQYGSASTITNEMFYPQTADQWKVIAYCDDVCFFKGFIVNDIEPYQLKDKPYDIVVRATDQLMKLKNFDLTDVDAIEFEGRNTLISYIAGALAKTNLDCDIVAYINTYNTTHNDRLDAGSPDMLTQTKLHHRSLLKDVSTFYDCYTALERILKGWAVLYQWEGNYVIYSVPELQKEALLLWYKTTYTFEGVFSSATQESLSAAGVGKQKFIQPIELDQFVSYQYPLKQVKTIYKYEIPENLVNNQKLQFLGDFIAPLSGSGYSAYELVGWGAYQGDPNGLTAYAGSYKTYIKTEFDSYNVESDRYYVIQADTGIATALGLQVRNDNADFWVDAGDKLTISITTRLLLDQGGSDPIFLGRVALLIDGTSGSSASDWYTLNPGGDWVNNPFANFAQTNETGDQTQWVTYSTEADSFPANGTLYLFLGSGGVDATNEAHHKDIEITYTPYIKGSRLSVKGDYWLTSQTDVITDKLEEEVYISDAPKRILKGALWDSAGTALTDPDWYRYGKTENRHFKEILNLGTFAHQYRGYRRISGTFKGVLWQPELLFGVAPFHPPSLHTHFYFENEPFTDVRYYVFSAPMEIDWVNARFRTTLLEVFRDGAEWNTTGDSHTFGYIFQ